MTKINQFDPLIVDVTPFQAFNDHLCPCINETALPPLSFITKLEVDYV